VADFGNNVQLSAAFRPWMPCPGNHEIEFGNGTQGFNSYLTRYSLPHNARISGLWYRFQVGSVLFISLSADDVIYQDSGAFVAASCAIATRAQHWQCTIEAGTSLYIRGYSNGAQTRWLEETLSAASKDESVDWIIVQMHQDALSSSRSGNGSDKGIRETWLPLFDRYGVDLVLCGHDHDYERSWPVRGCNHNVGRDATTGTAVDTCQPQPIITAAPNMGNSTRAAAQFILILAARRHWRTARCVWRKSSERATTGQSHHQDDRPAPGATAGTLHQSPARTRWKTPSGPALLRSRRV